jgi:hypothetical protein
MKIPNKEYFQTLLRRRDYLIEKIENNERKQIPFGYESAEVGALNSILGFATDALNNLPTICPDEEKQSFSKAYPRIESHKPAVLQEIMRYDNTKLVVSKRENNNVLLAIFHRDDDASDWHITHSRINIHSSEIPELINVLSIMLNNDPTSVK